MNDELKIIVYKIQYDLSHSWFDTGGVNLVVWAKTSPLHENVN